MLKMEATRSYETCVTTRLKEIKAQTTTIHIVTALETSAFLETQFAFIFAHMICNN